MSSDNPWKDAFEIKSYTSRLNSPEYFNTLLGVGNRKELHPTDEDDTVRYTVNTTELSITGNRELNVKGPPYKKTYAGSKYVVFFEWLKNVKNYTKNSNKDEIYYIMQSMKNRNLNLYTEIDNIFNTLLRAVNTSGSRRRRPSRKYKKSKRVLRKKSRSTRRR